MTTNNNEEPQLDTGDLEETVAEAVGDQVADELPVEAPAADTATAAAPSDGVLSPYEASVLSNITSQLRELFGAAGITQENVEKFAGNVRDAVDKGAEKIKEDDTVEEAIDDIQEFFKKINVKLNKLANDAVSSWNKSISDE